MFLQVALPAAGGAVPARAARPVRCRRQPGAASGPAGAASWLYTRASGRVGAKRARKVGSADRRPGAQHGPKEVGWDCAQYAAFGCCTAHVSMLAAIFRNARRPAWMIQRTTTPLPHAINPHVRPILHCRLAESAVELNLRLMRWRAAPSLDVGAIAGGAVLWGCTGAAGAAAAARVYWAACATVQC